MRGSDQRSGSLFSYVDLEARVRADHPLRPIRAIVNSALDRLSAEFDRLYAAGAGRPSIPPERFMRALLLQAFYGLRSERLLMERLEFDLLFRWFVGLGIDDGAWDQTSFGENRDRHPRAASPRLERGASGGRNGKAAPRGGAHNSQRRCPLCAECIQRRGKRLHRSPDAAWRRARCPPAGREGQSLPGGYHPPSPRT